MKLRLVKSRLILIAVAIAAVSAGSMARAQQDAETEKGLEKFRQMLKADPWANPGNLDVDRGEALWRTPRGPKKVSMEKCDLGKGPGVVDGAFAELPRYFADADRVMDIETRILWCMVELQGFDKAKLIAAKAGWKSKKPHPGRAQSVGDLGAMATYVASKSNGRAYRAPLNHPKEKAAVAIGDALFHRRQGTHDFSCATCHADAGKRIRLQPLPQLADPQGAREVVGEWPAYRVSNTHIMTMQYRLLDCYWQMRMPRLEFGSDASVALIAYLTKQAEGGKVSAPGLKR
jgi:sulfur-oxidizing protein SoxA